VVLSNGKQPCCGAVYQMAAKSSTVQVRSERVLPGGLREPMTAHGAFVGDAGVAFHISNLASYPIYARIIQEPLVSGEQLVLLPPPELQPRHPTRTDLVRLSEYFETELSLGIFPETHGGTIRVEVLAPDPAMGKDVLVPVGHVTVPLVPLNLKVDWDASFLARRAFTEKPTADVITLTATVDPPTEGLGFLWSVQARPLASDWSQASCGGCHTVRPTEPVAGVKAEVRNGATFSFVPDPGDHVSYWGGTDGKNPLSPWGHGGDKNKQGQSLAYEVTVAVLGLTSAFVVEQDEKAVIRQQYVNHGLDQRPAIGLPGLGDFTQAPVSAYWTSNIRLPNYGVVLGDPVSLADDVLAQYREVSNDKQLAPFGTNVGGDFPIVRSPRVTTPQGTTYEIALASQPCWDGQTFVTPCENYRVGNEIWAGPLGKVKTRAWRDDYDLAVESAWRNPERNEAVGGVLDSNHQLGNALDLVPTGTWPTQDARVTWCLLLDAAAQVRRQGYVTLAQTERGPAAPTFCDSGTANHVHVHIRRP